MMLTDDERAALRRQFAAQAGRHRATLERLTAALEREAPASHAEPLAALAFEAHAVRGAAAVVGLSEVADAARALERAAGGRRRDGDGAGAAAAARRLVEALDAFLDEYLGPDASAGGRPVVLHVEDNEANRRLLAAVLAHRPRVTLLEAATGDEALALAATPGIALVLLDLRLPGMTGEEVLERLRADPATRGLRVVVVSAEARVDERDRLFAAGADDFVVKPYDVEHVLSVVDDAVSRRLP